MAMSLYNMQGPLVEYNGLSYCLPHCREECNDCNVGSTYANELFQRFKLPKNGIPQYPWILEETVREGQLRTLLGRRWLDMQRVLYPGRRKPLTAALVRLPPVEVPDEVKSSPVALQGTLIQLFHHLQGMASTQRYYFANQSRIMLQDYDIFVKAAVLYEEELADHLFRKLGMCAMRGFPILLPAHKKRERLLKAKSSILNTFGFFLELNTQRTFWRAMELTMDAFVTHIERFNEEADGQVVVTDKAKVSFLHLLGHFFWSLQHAQCQLNKLREIQVEVYQRKEFPFFPYSLKALEEDSDIHLVIAKLSKARLCDLPLFSSLFSQLKQASTITEQMEQINTGTDLMAAIDELSTRFRFLETLVLAARLVATEDEIKSALVTFQFNPNGIEIKSRKDDVLTILSTHKYSHNEMRDPVMAVLSAFKYTHFRDPLPRALSFPQRLIVKENLFRQKNAHRVILPPFTTDKHQFGFSPEMFRAFKSNFTVLYRQSIRLEWREDECSLLSLDIARRFQHRRDISKKRRKTGASSGNYEQADVREARSVPEQVHVDRSLFWEIGDGTLEKYVPPVVRKKIKTHKQDILAELDEVHSSSNDAAPGAEDASPPFVQRSLGQLKHTDLITRDILWRKVKGNLKWTQLVQFLSRIGCQILNLDGSKRKIVDIYSGHCTVLHRPHPGDDCRPDQRESYRVHIEDWLKIGYSDLVLQNVIEVTDTNILDNDLHKTTLTDAQKQADD